MPVRNAPCYGWSVDWEHDAHDWYQPQEGVARCPGYGAPTVDVYGEDKSWMVPLIGQYMNGEEVVLPPRATSFRAGVADERPTRFWAVVMRDDGSEVEYSWRVDFS